MRPRRGSPRLFLLPGVAHCGGGEPDTFDALTAMTDWVTKGEAPSSLTTRSVNSGGSTTATRPVSPFRYVAENAEARRTTRAVTRPSGPPPRPTWR